MLVLGVVGGLVGGSILVFKMNARYRHQTFLSGIVRSAVLFVLIEDAIASRRAHYLERYAVNPRFKAGLHLGEATVGDDRLERD